MDVKDLKSKREEIKEKLKSATDYEERRELQRELLLISSEISRTKKRED